MRTPIAAILASVVWGRVCDALSVWQSESAQIENRIPNQLPRPVKRNVAAAIALENLDPAGGKLFG